VARPESPAVKEAIAAALAARSLGDSHDPQLCEKLSIAWNSAFLAAFDVARPPGRLECWARKSLPRVATCIHLAKLETTSPTRSDEIRMSAVVIFESQQRELHPSDEPGTPR